MSEILRSSGLEKSNTFLAGLRRVQEEQEQLEKRKVHTIYYTFESRQDMRSGFVD